MTVCKLEYPSVSNRLLARAAQALALLLGAAASSSSRAQPLEASEPGPMIDVWYGYEQSFGHVGMAQTWINVLGNVSDPDGVSSLAYKLNGGPVTPLSIGAHDPNHSTTPFSYRLADEGDFNIDLDWSAIPPGDNEITITAIDSLGHQSVASVDLSFTEGTVWPVNVEIDWGDVAEILDVAQPVDGLWVIEAESLRVARPGYDRILAIGDVLWHDYEVEVPITMHAIEERAQLPPSNAPAIGFVMRWTGHKIDGSQPQAGIHGFGALGVFRFNGGCGDEPSIVIYEHPFDDAAGACPEFPVLLGATYIFKMRVETVPAGQHYAIKVWEEGTSEPAAWDVEYVDDDFAAPLSGSFALLAHHVDATFGSVTISPEAIPSDDAPHGLFASNGTSASHVLLSWFGVSGAESYQVWRAPAGGVAAPIGTCPGSTVWYLDQTAQSGPTYLYWVRAKVSGAWRAFSEPDQGYVAVPVAPAALTASNGTSTSHVLASWQPVAGAAYYEVWRAPMGGQASAIGSSTGPAIWFVDSGAPPGVPCNYWVRARHGAVWSAFSAPDVGWRSTSPPPPAAPNGLVATSGDPDSVLLSWYAAPGAAEHQVWRRRIGSTVNAAPLGTSVNGAIWFIDATALQGVPYRYWVRSRSGAQWGAFSDPATGVRASP